MSAVFGNAIPVILMHEGTLQNHWVNDPDDPGGETIWGWSMLTIRRLGLVPRQMGLELDDFVPGCLKDVTQETCIELYRVHFWDRYGYDRFRDQRVATKIFDAAVNMDHPGHETAHKIAQAAAGMAPDQQDGILGLISVGVINLTDPMDFVNSYALQLAAFYRSIAVGPKLKFLPTWLKRAAWSATVPIAP